MRPRAPWAILALLAVLALGAWLRWTPRAAVADLRPWPDALEYEEAARSLHEGRGYLLWIGDAGYPPRYPPGFSLLVAASLPLAGTEPGSGIGVVLASALATIAGTFVLTRSVAGPAAGVVAALVVAVSPLHVHWSRAVMSDVPATAAVVWIAVWLVSMLRRRAGTAEHIALGVACGLAVWIRHPLAAFAVVACLAVGLLSRGGAAERTRRMVAVGLGVVLGVAPLLWLHWELFGHPLRTGYAYWAPRAGFSSASVAARTPGGRPSNLFYYGRLLIGGRAELYAWPAAVLLLAGTFAGVRMGGRARTLCALAWLTTLVFLVMLTSYSARTGRLLLPLLPLLAATMALACAADAPARLRVLGVALVAALLLVLGVQPASQGLRGRVRTVGDVATLEQIAATTEPNAAILAHTNPFAFARVLRRNADRVWVPLQRDAHQAAIRFRRSKPVVRDPAAASFIERPILWSSPRGGTIPTVEALCRSGRPVYFSTRPSPTAGFVRKTRRLLRRHFTLTKVVAAPYAVYRVACPDGSSP